MYIVIEMIKSFLYLHPGIHITITLCFFAQNLLFIGFVIGHFVDRKGKQKALDIDVMRYHFYKREAEANEQYKNAAGREAFYKKEAEHKNHENIKTKNILAAILELAGKNS